jgi:hypothetical protein
MTAWHLNAKAAYEAYRAPVSLQNRIARQPRTLR